MMIFDMFFYLVYRFSTKILKKDIIGSGFSAAAFLATYSGITSVTILCIIGLIKDNAISRWIATSVPIVLVAIGIVFYIVFWYRYFRMMDIEAEDIVKKIGSMSKTRKNFYKILVIIVLLAVPICFFIFCRLYSIGHIRWW